MTDPGTHNTYDDSWRTCCQGILPGELHTLRNHYRAAREYVKDWKVSWTTDPPSQEPDGWWRYTSMVNCDGAVALLQRAEDAEKKVAQLAGALHEAYLEVSTRETALTIRTALIRCDVDPEDPTSDQTGSEALNSGSNPAATKPST